MVDAEINKTEGYENATIWYKFTKLAQITGSANLGQGFPDWAPPKFLIDSIIKNTGSENAHHQYGRSNGSVKLAESIARNYSPIFKRTIDPLNEVVVLNGAVSVLYNTLTALVSQGDEVILLEPFYDCYLPQVKYSGGKAIGLPLIPPEIKDRSEFLNLQGNPNVKPHKWNFDFEKFKSLLNTKTKLLVLNSPNNPTGKVFTYEELTKIAEILKDFPKVIVVLDEVYDRMIYEGFEELPRMATIEGMWERTVSIMSAGKIFSATGIRVGWSIAPKWISQKINAIHQYNSFCLYDPIQAAVAEALDSANQPYEGFDTYYLWLKDHYYKQRNYLLENLAKIEKFNLNYWIPEGGYFIIVDITDQENLPKHQLEGDSEDFVYSKDFNYCINLAHEKKIVFIPLSPFFTSENKANGQNLIRIAFCKKIETLDKAFDNIKKYF